MMESRMDLSHSAGTESIRVSRTIQAPRSAIYQAFVDPDALASWLPPETMTRHAHEFDPRAGGRFRISLTYSDPTHAVRGETSDDTDTFHGRFAELVPDEKVVWRFEIESEDPGLGGETTVAFCLADAVGGTEVVLICENIPKGVRPEDNEVGCRLFLQKLAAFLE